MFIRRGGCGIKSTTNHDNSLICLFGNMGLVLRKCGGQVMFLSRINNVFLKKLMAHFCALIRVKCFVYRRLTDVHSLKKMTIRNEVSIFFK
ncbi:hypothetical protein DC487_01520 [Sphingobacterium corticibacter]|uniref:Uncharacterized protein n=1 Tax=Sphingobacterium corticibacter TaxID=2171749 RepID=A0A2T8HLK3_9SPHI|nr:hypothetical protein DC487_01520 [Sphingobacterium corticibacter]